MNNRVRYTRQNIISNNFYQLPKFLLDAEFANLSNDARVLYALLRNRHEISIKNEWFDENGEVFLYFKREEMQNLLYLSDKTITKAMNCLKEYCLLEEVKQGFSRPNKIYLLSAVPQPLGIEAVAPIPVNITTMDESQKNQHTRNIYDSIHGNITTREPENLRVYMNHNKEIYNERYISPVSSCQPKPDRQDKTDETETAAYEALIKDNIGYSRFTRPKDIAFIDELIMIMLDAIASKGEYIRIGREEKKRGTVESQLLKLTGEHITYVIDRFRSLEEPVTKRKQYLLSMLYNASMELESFYTHY